jgi:AraC-like DNA-binding protein
MPLPLKYFSETHMIGHRCREHILDSEHFPVLREAPFIWIGHSVLYSPYRMVRLNAVRSHIVVSISGRGRALIGGKMVDWLPGHALLAPIGLHHAFEIEGRGPWIIAWAFFDDTISAPTLRARHNQLVEANGNDFYSILQMLTREAAGAGQPAMMAALVTLLDVCSRRMAGIKTVDPRLWRLWEKVETDLSRDWNMRELARIACMSEEHLRRLCHKHYQRSPVDYLTHLRLRRASMMLRSSHEKVDLIAQHVGYASMYSFSSAFRRWSGMPPTEFRRNAI